MNLKKNKKIPPQKTMKKRQGGGLSSARAMVWLNVSRECELFTLTVTKYTEKNIIKKFCFIELFHIK